MLKGRLLLKRRLALRERSPSLCLEVGVQILRTGREGVSYPVLKDDTVLKEDNLVGKQIEFYLSFVFFAFVHLFKYGKNV
ncbi:hypothetical protein AT239_04000 [Bartonella henselae]|nr:hypothetical protein AT239_04000 [Bartonella henselae]OLL53421.1 hypothetical protein AT240_03030 [Bartonella henselae]